MSTCTYRINDASGKEVVITGQADMKAFLADGGLEQLLPGKVLPWNGKNADADVSVPAAQKSGIDDFGAKLEGARKFAQASVTKEWSDDDIASQPFSKIWPATDIDAIADPFEAAVMFAARAEVPAKPRVAYKVKAWVEKVKAFRSITAQAMDTFGRNMYREEMGRIRALDGFRSKVALLEALDRSHWKRIGAVSEHPNAYTFNGDEKVPAPQSIVEIDGKRERFEGSGSVLDALDKIKEKLGVDASPKKMQFEVRGREGMYSINKKGDKEYRKLKTFSTSKEAFEFIKNSHEELVSAWDSVKDRDNVGKADVRNETNRPRTGSDWRKGKDVTPEQFSEAFGFRGVQFGNWVSQGSGGKDRQGLLNQAYDALMDLADIVGIPPKAISLNGTLGLSFGARGSGWAAAHFEPGNLVINLTKTKGAGTLAHEWFHALDNYFSRQRGGEVKIGRGVGAQEAYRTQNFITYRPEPMYVHKSQRSTPITKAQLERYHEKSPGSDYYDPENWQIDPSHPQGVRPEVERAFADLVEALDKSPMKIRSAKNDKGADGYWSRIIERGARSFENYVIHKMRLKGYDNDYLANVRKVEDFPRDAARYPYLLEEEVAPIAEAFDALFAGLKTQETDQGVALLRTESDLTETPAFREWFGRSKMTAKDGKPLVFMHGSPASFDAFSSDKLGGNSAHTSAGLGHFFTRDIVTAERYADGGNIYRGWLKIERPYVMPLSEAQAFKDVDESAARRAQLQKDGFDGVLILDETGKKAWATVAFEPWQFKSTDNNGNFDEFEDGFRLRDTAMRYTGDVPRADAENFIRKFVAEYPGAPSIMLVDSFDQLPKDIQKDALAQGSGPTRAKGAMKNGATYVVLNNHHSMADLQATIFHEIKGHAGIRKLLGPKFSQELNKLFVGLGGYSGLERIMTERGLGVQFHGYFDAIHQAKERDPDTWTDALATSILTEEVFAHISEQDGNKTLMDRFKRIVGMVRDWLRRHGFAELADLGETDILFMLQKAGDGMRQGSGVVREGSHVGEKEIVDADGRPIAKESSPDYEALKTISGRLGLREREAPTVFSFAGEFSKGSDKRSLRTAKKRIGAGDSKEDVRKDTGWFDGIDGKWRYEINDKDARLNIEKLDGLRNARHGSSYALGTLLDHPKLYAAYPFLKRLRVFDTNFEEFAGGYDPDTTHIELNLNLSNEDALSFLLHEVQHAIQNREGFAVGSSAFLDKDYRKSAGEVEARNIQARHRMTDAERRATSPGETADVSDDDVIVVFNGEEMQNAPMPENADAPAVLRTMTADELANAAQPRGQMAKEVMGNILSAFKQPTSKVFGPLHTRLSTQLHKAWVNKDYGKVFHLADSYERDISRFSANPAAAAPDLLPAFDNIRDAASRFIHGNKTARLTEGVADALFSGTLAGEDVTDGRVWTDAELRDQFNLSDDQIKLYREARAAIDASLDATAAGLAWQSVKKYIPEFKDSVKAEPSNAETIIDAAMRRAEEELREVARYQAEVEADGAIPEGTAAKTLKKAQDVAEARKAAESIFMRSDALKEAGYAPLMRFGRFAVDVVETQEDGAEERLGFYKFETEIEAKMAAQKLQKEHPNATVTRSVMSEEAWKLFKGVDPDLVSLFADKVDGLEGLSVDNEVLQEWYRSAVNQRSAFKRMIHRKGVEGFDKDLTRVVASFITSNARVAARQFNMGDIAQAISDMQERKVSGDVVDEAVRLKEYMENPTEPFQALKGWMFAWFLGGSVASAALNLTQPLMMTLPYLSQYGAGKAAAQLTKAAKEAATNKVADEELKRALAKAAKDGKVDPQQVHHLYHEGMRPFLSKLPLGDGLRERAQGLMTLWGYMFGATENFNRRITFIAAYRMAKDDPSVGNPYDFAIKAIDETQGIYGKSNRPNWARGTGPFGAIGVAAFTFKQYSIGYIELLVRMAKSGKNGRLGAAMMLGLLVMMSGIQGAPGADDLEDIIDTVSQYLGYTGNSRLAIRQKLRALLGEEAAKIVMHGGLSALPFDIAGRVGMGNLLPATAIFKPSEQNRASQFSELFGPPLSMSNQVLDAALAMESGAGIGGVANAFAPVAVRNLMKAYDMASTGEYRDSKGRKVTDVSLMDAAFKAGGLQPTVVSDEQKGARLVQMTGDRIRQVKAAINGLKARAIVENDNEMRAKADELLADWNRSNPDARIMPDGASVLRRVKEMRAERRARVMQALPREYRKVAEGEMN